MKTTTEIEENLQLKASAFGLQKIDIENLLLSFTNAVATEMGKQKQWQSSIDFLNAAKSVIGELEIEKKELETFIYNVMNSNLKEFVLAYRPKKHPEPFFGFFKEKISNNGVKTITDNNRIEKIRKFSINEKRKKY